jgi:hypothetical protein
VGTGLGKAGRGGGATPTGRTGARRQRDHGRTVPVVVDGRLEQYSVLERHGFRLEVRVAGGYYLVAR